MLVLLLQPRLFSHRCRAAQLIQPSSGSHSDWDRNIDPPHSAHLAIPVNRFDQTSPHCVRLRAVLRGNLSILPHQLGTTTSNLRSSLVVDQDLCHAGNCRIAFRSGRLPTACR